MQKIKGPFRLYCRDRSVHAGHGCEAATIAELIRDCRVPLGRIGEHRFIKRYAEDWAGQRWFYDTATQDHHYLIRDSAGLIVPLWFIREELDRAGLEEYSGRSYSGYWYRRYRNKVPRDKISGDWSVFRNINGAGCPHFSRGSYYRNPRNAQERREQERTYAELREYTQHISSRVRRHLVSSYDDIYPVARRNRNWKQFRRTRYRPRRGTV